MITLRAWAWSPPFPRNYCSRDTVNQACINDIHKRYPPTKEQYAALVPYFYGPTTKPPEEETEHGAVLPDDIIPARNHNAFNSFIASLPTEILLMLHGYADTASIMALRGTCHRLKNVFADPTADANNIWQIENWRRKYTAQRRSFQISQLCAKERNGQLPVGNLVCYSCGAAHSLEYFQHHDLNPESRSCGGFSGQLRLCEHKSTTLSTLKHYNPDLWCGRPHSQYNSYLSALENRTIFQACGTHRSEGLRFYHGDRSGGGRGVRIGIMGYGLDEEGRAMTIEESAALRSREGDPGREVVMRAEVVLLQVQKDERVEIDEIQNALRDVNERTERGGLCMCPHLSFSVVSDLVTKHPYEDCLNPDHHTEITKPCPEPGPPKTWCAWLRSFWEAVGQPCGRKYHCPHPKCETYFSFYRARHVSFHCGYKDEVVLCVVRKLGACRNPFDKRWLVQLEDASNAAEDDGRAGKWKGKARLEEDKQNGRYLSTLYPILLSSK